MRKKGASASNLLRGGFFMGKNIKRIMARKYLLTILIIWIAVGSTVSLSYGAGDRDLKYGFSTFGGTGDIFHKGIHVTMYGFLPRLDIWLHRNWDLEFEGNFSHFDIRREHDFYFLGINGNLLFKPLQGSWGSLFLLAGGGLGYDSAGSRVKQLGDQHFGGILQTGAGIFFKIGKDVALRLEYRLHHISEPFRKDIGLNTHNVLFGVSF